MSITVEIISSSASDDSTSYSSTSLYVSTVTSESISSIISVNFSEPLSESLFTEMSSLVSERNQVSETVSKFSGTTSIDNRTSLSESSESINVVKSTPLIFANSTSIITSALENSFDISALPRVLSVTGRVITVESGVSKESSINGESTTDESTVTQRMTHTSIKLSSLELSYIGLPTTPVSMSHSIATETVSGIEYIVTILECPTCENGVTVITPSGNMDNNVIVTETDDVLQSASHLPVTHDIDIICRGKSQ